MTKSRAAEWILSQVLPPDRVASTVGDWLEDVDRRGNLWFWSCVFRTILSQILDDVTGNLAATARIGLLGFARCIVILIGMRLVAEAIVASHYLRLLFADPTRWQQFALTFYLLQTWWYFQTGRWIARRSPGHELTSCIAVSLVGWLALAAELTLTPLPGATAHLIVFGILPPGIAHDLILLAGILSQRRAFIRRLAHT